MESRCVGSKMKVTPIIDIAGERAPYASNTIFYANKQSKKIVPVTNNYTGKGWWEHTVGSYTAKSRDKSGYMSILRKHYPGYKKISLFSETSYHSGYDKKGKITNYGTKDYTLEYSTYKPMSTYTLIQPVKTERQSMFAKKINKVTLQEWNYIAIDWFPEKNITLQIKHTVSTPFGDKKTIYKSRRYTLSQKDKVISDFKAYVRKHG